ncbi:thioesterase II family protein [Streptomyces sporangiiformans]|uniref:Thioesterase n=1 Tax=Streptomyces sporangiiformans TaxID=2315329 RepID=A0A505DC83_9ACTN|nr:alpha/beta fold hydrolase [Streptomyces sporangiiformans]TPQ20082.1 thioesterase [Streptomyces sporangiiformans]
MYQSSSTASRPGGGTAPWLLKPQVPVSPQALTLVCVPHAGAGPGVYRAFARQLAPHVSLRLVHLPGRESRVGEPALDSLPRVVRAALPALVPELRGRFALWGHSMGGFVAFELARVLQARFGLRAEALVVSGCQAPRSPERAALPQRRLMEDDELWLSAADLNGIPAEITGNGALRELLLPTLRADFAVFETYEYRAGPPLSCPLHVFAGRDDPEASAGDMEAWKLETRSDFTLTELAGGHFFHLEDPVGFSDRLTSVLWPRHATR